MAPDPRQEDELDEYESSEDSDFAPEDDNAAGPESDSEDGGQDGDAPTDEQSKRRRAPADDTEADDAGFENSGDEAIIIKGNKRKKKKRRKGAPAGDDDGAAADDDDGEQDEGGEGGLIKTRSMRAQEKEEKKAAAASGPVTVDVDALWAQMVAGQAPASRTATGDSGHDSMDVDGDTQQSEGAGTDVATVARQAGPDTTDPSSPMIRIKRTYNFAGKVHTEEKLVHRDSAEAKLHLAAQRDANGDLQLSGGDVDGEGEGAPRLRVLKKAFRSAFEPVVDAASSGSARADLHLGVGTTIQARGERDRDARAKKLNTVEKSRMDWAGFVDQEGLKDELDLAGRAKGSFAERQGFLARSEAKREDQAWKARMAGRA